MAIKRFIANKDTTIVNAYKQNLTTRASSANMGAADILETYTVYKQAGTASSELARILVDFPVGEIAASRAANDVPASGSVTWYLRMFNAEHAETLPNNYTLRVSAISQSWDEGYGLDMHQYLDPGVDNSGEGATWNARTKGAVSQGSLLLDGTADYVTVSDHDDFTFSNNSDSDSAFSVSAWVYLDDLGAATPILTKWNTTSSNKREWQLNVQVTTGLVFFLLYDETNVVYHEAKTTTALSAATWYHITATYDGSGGASGGSGIKIYIDGTSDTLTVTNDSSYVIMRNTAADVIIGAETSASTFFDGKLDEISVWDKELTAANVTELYNDGCPTELRFHSVYISSKSNLVAWWRFETKDVETQDSTTTIKDHSINSHDGTGTSLVAGSLSTATPAACATEVQYWLYAGGTFETGSTLGQSTTQDFSNGDEDLKVDVSQVVEEWLKYNNDSATGRATYGLGVYFSSTQQTGSRSYYTKKFYGRNSEYFFARPILEARWDSSTKDNAGNFFLSSSLMNQTDNLNTIYLYNVVKGKKKDIPRHTNSNDPIFVSIYSSSAGAASGGKAITLPQGGNVVSADHWVITGGWVNTGTYSASFGYTSSANTTIYPVWHTITSSATYSVFQTGSAIAVNTLNASSYSPNRQYVSTITNLKPVYSRNETARLRLFVREKDWNPTIYTKASATPTTSIVEDAYFKVIRLVDDYEVVSYGTGSLSHTLLSYDSKGNYFDLDMSMLEADYAYGFKFAFKTNDKVVEQDEVFKFRVE